VRADRALRATRGAIPTLRSRASTWRRADAACINVTSAAYMIAGDRNDIFGKMPSSLSCRVPHRGEARAAQRSYELHAHREGLAGKVARQP